MTSTLSITHSLENRARELALTHDISVLRTTSRRNWQSMIREVKSLRTFCDELMVRRAHCHQPAEDWLIDHADFIEKQSQIAQRDVPLRLLRTLPSLERTDEPRLFALCNDYLEFVSGVWQASSFEAYVAAYQEVSTLKLVECQVMPTMLRRSIIYQLARTMREVQHRHNICLQMERLFSTLQQRNHGTKQRISERLEGLAIEDMSPVELVHFRQHLNELTEDGREIRVWLDRHIERGYEHIDDIVSSEHQFQADLQVTCGHLVQSLHALERPTWENLIRRLSNVHQLLSLDVTHEYRRLDTASQDCLCGHVARLATKCRVAEAFVAKAVISLATASAKAHSDATVMPRSACVAFYLLDPVGVQALYQAMFPEVTPSRFSPRRWPTGQLPAYFAVAGVTWGLLMACMAVVLAGSARPSVGGWVAIFVGLALPVSEWAVQLIHAGIVRCCSPRPLLRLDFSEKMPSNAKTIVVMPILWSTVEEVDDVMDRLEVHHLANRGDEIHFAVLADFPDAASETTDDDDGLIQHALLRTRRLQEKYGQQRFYLFHRSRIWNEEAKTYMGWERKRGKLVAFVELLRGRSNEFTTLCGDLSLLPDIRYVFTVDHDTILPIGIVRRLAATMHCTYNRPRLNAAKTRVVEGHGVLQPRVGVSMKSTMSSRFARLWASEPGVDPYAFAVSDPYQDWFSQAIFVGKGLFDVASFAETIIDRIPDNRVLSHDLLEGGFLRAGLATDMEVVDEQPTSFYAYQQRLHRWIRGDWQLLPWLRGACENRSQGVQRNDLCGLTRWQMIDNLRRSVMAPVLFLILILGFVALPGRPLVWALVVLVTLYMPALLVSFQTVRRPRQFRRLAIIVAQCSLHGLTLPFAAVLAADAVFRTLYRISVSRRHLLEWVTSHTVSRHQAHRRVFEYTLYGFAAIALFAILIITLPTIETIRVVGLIFAFLWMCAYPLVGFLSRPIRGSKRNWLLPVQHELYALAADIWRFYSTYVTEQESWLPPDNVQFQPVERVAHRTSPTNIGLYLASVVAANQLDIISLDDMVARISKTMKTIEGLAKWNGHLFNWYDTQTAEPLEPKYVSTVDSGNFVAYLITVRQAVYERMKASNSDELTGVMANLTKHLEDVIQQTDFSMLFDRDARLFALGFHVTENRRETILYDLLASEARQASLVAIALGQIPASHWFALGRTTTRVGKYRTLLSWSGTMFEYLMPQALLRTYPNTIWQRTYRGVALRQQLYANEQGVPFGISESGYYAFDYQMNYQYRAFGVPGLGFDLGQENHLVISPYATILAMPFAGSTSVTALHRIAKLGGRGEYGFYEAVDFTPKRLPPGRTYEVIQSFMAHHQGMSLLTLTNVLCGDTFQDLFHADARIKAVDLLLQERVTVDGPIIETPTSRKSIPPTFHESKDGSKRTYRSRTNIPEVAVLSNGHLTSVTTNDGTGFITWGDVAVTRFREDPVVDSWGPVLYVHDLDAETILSSTRFPCQAGEQTECEFSLDRAVFKSRTDAFLMTTEIAVASGIDAEVRRVRIENRTEEPRVIEVTSFLELSLAKQAADVAHPAFNKLFVETAFDETEQILLAKRRPHAPEEDEIWSVHAMFVDHSEVGSLAWDTDRSQFIGRGHSLSRPVALTSKLTASAGAVTDPAFVMQRTVRVTPGSPVTVYLVTGMAKCRADVMEIARSIRHPADVETAFHTAWIRSRIDLRHVNLAPADAATAQVLAARLLFHAPLTSARKQAMMANSLGQSALWAHGISGDKPILAVHISHIADMPFVVQVAQRQQYLQSLGFLSDLVVIDETPGGYQDDVNHLFDDALSAKGIGHPANIVLLKASALTDAERLLLSAVARVELRANGPSLMSQLHVDTEDEGVMMPVFHRPKSQTVTGSRPVVMHTAGPAGSPRLAEGEFDNGWGRFVDDGQAYEIDVLPGRHLPRPWSNVIANRRFGTLVTELGTGYSWWRNASECKLTPWSNDPVLDPPGECLYLTDAATGQTWSAMPRPAGQHLHYTVTHGRGFTRVSTVDAQLRHEVEIVVPLDDPLKVMQLTLQNDGAAPRTIRLTYYAEWVIGVTRAAVAPFVTTAWDDECETLYARNTYQETFREAVAFLHIGGRREGERVSFTGDRTAFLGRGGSTAGPVALAGPHLANQTGQFANSCGAVQTEITIAPGEIRQMYVLLGCTDSEAAARHLVDRYQSQEAYVEMRQTVDAYWEALCGQVVVKTPDRTMDLMLNGPLLYQALACRMWGRTAFYQAGGAYGYRDQLQDGLALLHADAVITRAQILRSAAHQYEEGDVQHWWHEETGKGIRTTFSDDLLWLPYVVSRYVEHLGDLAILREQAPFLQSPCLQSGEVERYEAAAVSDHQASILEHCLRAIDHALRFGQHGIPLMGAGDWNDGMSRVGVKGIGESVWLGWFLLDILKRFISLGEQVLGGKHYETYRQAASELSKHLNEEAWDGAWFRRAYTDDGRWLGSIESGECRIDAIAQSWAIISDGSTTARGLRAMKSFDRELVDREARLAKLLTPAFDESNPSPGYIQAYPPGIRENGGQYTHGVIWGVIAWSLLGQADKAYALWCMLNPMSHTQTSRDVMRYGGEPYVMSADVYTADVHYGQAGWSWYTGAAGWMYQAGLEYILGIRRRGDKLFVDPCVPPHWDVFSVRYRHGKTTYEIEVDCQGTASEGVSLTVDGRVVQGQDWLTLADDGQMHHVQITRCGRLAAGDGTS